MILLLGGTSETAPIAEGLAEAGHEVLVSTCTDIPLNTGAHAGITVRTGPLNEDSLTRLINDRHITAVVDATHPYAEQISGTASSVCARRNVPCHRFLRPGLAAHLPDHVCPVPDHGAAAECACASGGVILLTTGSHNLAPYVTAARRNKCRLLVRVLDCSDSVDRCRQAGIPPEDVITGRGPFSAADNEALIRRFAVDVLVTKDAGDAGGVKDKFAAAERTGCRVVLVTRPAPPTGPIHTTIPDLINAVGGG